MVLRAVLPFRQARPTCAVQEGSRWVWADAGAATVAATPMAKRVAADNRMNRLMSPELCHTAECESRECRTGRAGRRTTHLDMQRPELTLLRYSAIGHSSRMRHQARRRRGQP